MLGIQLDIEKNYRVKELVHNHSFRRMALGTASSEEIEKWSHWIEASDENRTKAKKALSEIAGFKFESPELPDFEKQWACLEKDTVDRYRKSSPGRGLNDPRRWLWRGVAAILLVGVVGLSTYFYSENIPKQSGLEQITVEETLYTERNHKKTILFRNGDKKAKIVLNSNSELTYSKGVSQDEPIKISLQGEAFFDVDKGFANNHPAFSVTTPDGVVEDVGTEFLVSVKQNHTRLVLQEGLVNLKVIEDHTTTKTKELQFSKGEMVEFRRTGIMRREIVNSTFYTSWATGYMQFEKTKISTFADYVEQRFDVEVKIENTDLTNITLDGAIYFTSLEELVRSVSDIAKFPVYQSGNTIYIGNANTYRAN